LFEKDLPTLNQTNTIISSTINIKYEGIIQEILLSMYQQRKVYREKSAEAIVMMKIMKG